MLCVASRDTFAHVTRWLQELRENSSVTDKMVVILVGNKNDKEGRYVGQKPRPISHRKRKAHPQHETHTKHTRTEHTKLTVPLALSISWCHCTAGVR